MLNRVQKLASRCSLSCLGHDFQILVKPDDIYGGRIYLQIAYSSVCVKTGKAEDWKGRKYYLSEYMTDDEIIKTIWVAFEQCIKHEVLEGFRVDGKILFNPHVNFEELLKVCDREVTRNELHSEFI